MRMSQIDVTVADALRAAATRIDRIDAELLLLHVVERERIWLFTHDGEVLDDANAAAFDALIARREAGEPVAYLIGTRGFWTLDLTVTPDTLIPRPETERLVELALERIPLNTAARIVDLGTGSGAIALAIARERPHSRVIATDASEAALAVAKLNAVSNGIGNVEFRRGSWYAPLHAGVEKFDLIVSNPPYIAISDPHLGQGDLRFEPRSALVSGIDGLKDLVPIVNGAASHLVHGGHLLVEHGWEQGEVLGRLFRGAGFHNVLTFKDLLGHDRVTSGTNVRAPLD